MKSHRFLGNVDENIKKGLNQLFLYGNGLDDYFLFDAYMGIRSLRDNLFYYFIQNRDKFDYFIEVNGENIVAFDENNKQLSLTEAFSIKKSRGGFGSAIHSSEFKKDMDKDATSDIENQATTQAGFNARDRIIANYNEYNLFIYIADVEWQANLYKDENMDIVRFLKDLKLSKNSVSVVTIKNLDLLKKFDFDLDEKNRNTIYIGYPNTEEIKRSFIRETLRIKKDIEWHTIDELAQMIQSNKKTLRETIKILKKKLNSNDVISLKVFEDVLDSNIKEKVSFNDVVLQDKENIINIIKTFLENKENAQKGIMLYGPPGTGKTYIAKAIANEFKMYFLAPTLADIKGEFVGESGKHVKRLFEEARANAPTIIFLDEMDTIFRKRGEGDSYVEDMVNQFLVEIDGVNSSEDKIFIVGATNRLDTVDDAMKSRLSSKFKVDLPHRNDREKIISKQFKKFNFFKSDFKDYVLDRTEGMSGRDLTNLCKNVKAMSENENIKRKSFELALSNFEKDLINNFQDKLDGSLKVEIPSITLKDVVGYRNIVEALRDELDYVLMDREEKALQEKFGIKQSRGTILYGPPGNGKTTFAEALAGERDFYYIRVVSKDFISSIREDILKKLELIFDYSIKLSKITNKEGVVLFFDEIDSLISKGFDNVIRGTLLKYLEDKNGIKANDSKVILMSATNHFNLLDEASIREGRFDNKFEIRNPNDEEMVDILKAFLNRDNHLLNRLDDDYIREIANYLKAQKNNKVSIIDIKNLKERIKRFAYKRHSIIDDKIEITQSIVDNF